MPLFLIQHGKSLPKTKDMERLTSYLITGSIERQVFKFQNGGIVCLDENPDTQSWVIKWTLMPHIE